MPRNVLKGANVPEDALKGQEHGDQHPLRHTCPDVIRQLPTQCEAGFLLPSLACGLQTDMISVIHFCILEDSPEAKLQRNETQVSARPPYSTRVKSSSPSPPLSEPCWPRHQKQQKHYALASATTGKSTMPRLQQQVHVRIVLFLPGPDGGSSLFICGKGRQALRRVNPPLPAGCCAADELPGLGPAMWQKPERDSGPDSRLRGHPA